MIKISNSKLILVFTKLLILLVVAKLISFGVWWILPSNGIELSINENYQPKYQRVSFKNMIKTEINVVKAKKKDSGKSITNMVLKGLYGKAESGFVIVAMKTTPKTTSIIEVGEEYEGYTLITIFANSAKFHKNGNDFMLNLEKVKIDHVISMVKKIQKSSSESPSVVNRNDIAYYSNNPKQVWRDISIKEIRDGKKIKGFKITKILKDSRFSNLGLKKGDLIIKANNVKIQSYRDAIDIYSRIDKIDMMQIVVIRDNKEVELGYEIN